MSFSLRFLDIAKLKKIEQYVLVREDRRIMFHNIGTSVDTFSAFVCDAGEKCLGLESKKGRGQFQHLIINFENNKKIVLFSVSKYFLGIILENHSDPMEIVNEVSDFIIQTQNSITVQ